MPAGNTSDTDPTSDPRREASQAAGNEPDRRQAPEPMSGDRDWRLNPEPLDHDGSNRLIARAGLFAVRDSAIRRV
ncbi:hypothetical protein ABVB69_38820, partial [Streptomyces sp. NPDC000349]|uniref:hypothetical protein n=1 Tax=Streptomyces sp. NPDC000349 TaxID=3154249 RepID=UPI003369C18C